MYTYYLHIVYKILAPNTFLILYLVSESTKVLILPTKQII